MKDSVENDRYQRQRVLPQIGAAGQARLGRARLLLIGCGALGSLLAELLARAGAGWLRIVDRDLVELNNLQRQSLFDEQDAAEELPKAIAAAGRLRRINSGIQIEPLVADANPTNIEHLAGIGSAEGKVDLILDGTDNVAARYLINDLAVKHRIPWVYGACVGVEGRVMGIWPGRTACLRCLFPQPPKAGDLPTCDTAGVLGAASAAVAALQAAIAIRFLVQGPLASFLCTHGPLSPSPCTQGEGRGEGEFESDEALLKQDDPHPNPLPEYMERGQEKEALLSLDVWTGQFRFVQSAAQPRQDCPCCRRGQLNFLSTAGVDFTTTLCGRDAVQVLPGGGTRQFDLDAMAGKWRNVGMVQRSPWFLRCRLHEPSGVQLTLFPDGRALFHGVSDPMRAKSLYARFIGT